MLTKMFSSFYLNSAANWNELSDLPRNVLVNQLVCKYRLPICEFKFGVEFSTHTRNALFGSIITVVRLRICTTYSSTKYTTMIWLAFRFYCRFNILHENIYTRCCCGCGCAMWCLRVYGFLFHINSDCIFLYTRIQN